MTMSDLDPDLTRFILTCVSSVPLLEALLLVRREPSQWSAQKLAARLYIGTETAQTILLQLLAKGMVSSTDEQFFHYAPQSPELEARVAALAHAYTKQLLEITRLIHSHVDRSAQHFADAFRLRED